jgi:hypothetical protein
MSPTKVLDKQGKGYEVKVKNKVSHLFCMDDLKLFSRDKTELQQELTIVKTFSDNIKTDLVLDKYATADLKHGKIYKRRNVSLNNQTVIRNLFLITNQRINYSNLFCHKTLHVSGIFSAYHQEFSTVHAVLVSFMQF